QSRQRSDRRAASARRLPREAESRQRRAADGDAARLRPGGALWLAALASQLVADELLVAEILVCLEVALEPADLRVALERQHVRRDPIEEPAVVGHDDRAAGKAQQSFLER